MNETISKLKTLIEETASFLENCPREEMDFKPTPAKWSKKEILGHLVDSGINNLQRFTEIQYQPKPYPIRGYDQDDLVRVNDYQNAEPVE